MFLYKTTPVACCCKAQVNGSCFVMELWDKAERLWTRVKNWKTVRGWHIWKLKLVDARLYFVSMFVGLLTGLVAVPYHYLLYYLFHLRSGFFASHPAWYWHIPLFLFSWGILVFVMWLVGKMPLIGGGGIPQTRGVINGRITYRHPFIEMVSKFVGGILSFSAGLSLGREGPSVQIGSYVGSLVSRWTHILKGEQKQLLAAGAGAGLAAAFAAPLASSLIVIESIERFDAPKTAITTLLAGVVAGAVASMVFPVNPYHLIEVTEPVFEKGMLSVYAGHAFYQEGNIQKWQMENCWNVQQDNRYPEYPRLEIMSNAGSNNTLTSDFWVLDASFLKVRNVQLGYTLPEHIVKKFGSTGMRFYVSLDNPLTFKGYRKGWDPENTSNNGQYYPTMSTYTLGLTLKF